MALIMKDEIKLTITNDSEILYQQLPGERKIHVSVLWKFI